MLLQGMEGGWVVIEASHTVRSGLNVTCHMLSDLSLPLHLRPSKCKSFCVMHYKTEHFLYLQPP